MKTFKEFLASRESSAFTRLRDNQAKGLAVGIPDAGFNGHSTFSGVAGMEKKNLPKGMSFGKKKKKKKHNKKKKKLHEAEHPLNKGIDSWLDSVDKLKKDIDSGSDLGDEELDKSTDDIDVDDDIAHDDTDADDEDMDDEDDLDMDDDDDLDADDDLDNDDEDMDGLDNDVGFDDEPKPSEDEGDDDHPISHPLDHDDLLGSIDKSPLKKPFGHKDSTKAIPSFGEWVKSKGS